MKDIQAAGEIIGTHRRSLHARVPMRPASRMSLAEAPVGDSRWPARIATSLDDPASDLDAVAGSYAAS